MIPGGVDAVNVRLLSIRLGCPAGALSGSAIVQGASEVAGGVTDLGQGVTLAGLLISLDRAFVALSSPPVTSNAIDGPGQSGVGIPSRCLLVRHHRVKVLAHATASQDEVWPTPTRCRVGLWVGGQSRAVAMIRVVQESPHEDACPLCGITLGMPRRATRRQIILSPRPGLFCWRCPDCKGVWAVRSVRHAVGEDLQTPMHRTTARAPCQEPRSAPVHT